MGDGDDQLFGERGRGDFEAGPEGDDLDGGRGDDLVVGGRGGGHDHARFSTATGGITMDLRAGTASGPGVGNDTIRGVLHVFGSRFDDTIMHATLVDAGDGDDFIGGVRDSTSLAIGGGPGDDHIIATSGSYSGGPGNDLIRARGGSTLHGDEGDDVLIGSDEVETMLGGEGTDELRGRGGNDRLQGGPGDDDLIGGPGMDRMSFYGELAIVIDRAAGTASGASIGQDTIAGIDEISATTFDDVINGRFDFVYASSGNDEVRGAVRAYGADGDDLLVGDRRSALLEGDDGDDILVGGDGDDYLDGGEGQDVGDGADGVDTCVDVEEATGCEAL